VSDFLMVSLISGAARFYRVAFLNNRGILIPLLTVCRLSFSGGAEGRAPKCAVAGVCYAPDKQHRQPSSLNNQISHSRRALK